jgi:multidrug resistance efflux pump
MTRDKAMNDKPTERAANEDEVDGADAPPEATGDRGMDPVRKWTFVILGLCAVLLVYYLVADRVTPVTTQARVHALVVPIAPEVSGTVIEVAVTSNQLVEKDDVLFRVDPSRYELSVETARANLESARQATGATTAAVDAAVAQLAAAEASFDRAAKDTERLRRIKDEDPGAISDRRLEVSEASLAVAESQVDAARANLARAREELGQAGDQNSRILQAQAGLDQARLDLQRTEVRAPDEGIVTEVRVDVGNFAQAGAPLMTFLATHDAWVQADFTENNLGHIKPGDRVELVFDALPGRVVEGTVRTTGFGVSVDSAPLGSLPTIDNDRTWLREAQRFSVLVNFEMPEKRERLGLRIGAQATVVVYTGSNPLFNSLAWLRMRLVSLFTYAY